MADETFELDSFIRTVDALRLRRHSAAGAREMLSRKQFRPFLNDVLQSLSRNKGIDESTVQRARRTFEASQRKAAFSLCFLNGKSSWLTDAKPFAELRGGHADRLSDRPDPAGRRAGECCLKVG